MSRYTGPKARVSRRLGTNIFGTKGEATALDKRPYPPGEHGRSRRRTTTSEYLLQLQEKQKARFTYGLTERQFRNLYAEASRRTGVTGENMLTYLELRLDNIVYRTGWAATRPQARQFVLHGHLSVNGRRVSVPSYRVAAGDEIAVKEQSRANAAFQWNVDVLDRVPPVWLEVVEDGWAANVLSVPSREQIDVPIREQLIVELYSK
ncbi:MAG: 30S ribosomal protein S4 [bacterium]|nr:30S ribosomal protein S4 [bacterium]MXZ31654.1 30S ribosomal protein S4 [Acidimicrobiia bacterium]MDE0667549.1 30S ribosomal protein S4 [bacterium]MYB24854.1 30S ribosomal protein S4 [Acidimicrobiia bacterium]MYE68226.1 30S ribosomal protein S4 [Acidimicrobiia bacterium]